MIKKQDLNVGCLIKTSLSEDVLIVQDLDNFKPADHKFFAAKLLAKPDIAFKSREEVNRFLLGPNRCMALGPDGTTYFPRVRDIFYINKKEEKE